MMAECLGTDRQKCRCVKSVSSCLISAGKFAMPLAWLLPETWEGAQRSQSMQPCRSWRRLTSSLTTQSGVTVATRGCAFDPIIVVLASGSSDPSMWGNDHRTGRVAAARAGERLFSLTGVESDLTRAPTLQGLRQRCLPLRIEEFCTLPERHVCGELRV